jgi:alpha-tubulin suppressor-like RCC1 family protein
VTCQAACALSSAWLAQKQQQQQWHLRHHYLHFDFGPEQTIARVQLGMSSQRGYFTVAVDEEHENTKAAAFSAPIAAIRPALPGPLFTWGDSSSGRLGHNDDAYAPVPCTVKASNMHMEPQMQVRSVSMGRNFMVFCTLAGKVFVCGSGALGQLGLKGIHSTENRIVNVDGFAFPVIQVVSGVDHTLALQENGSVYCWGVGSYGVLGLGGDSDIKEPTLIPTLDRKSIVCVF